LPQSERCPPAGPGRWRSARLRRLSGGCGGCMRRHRRRTGHERSRQAHSGDGHLAGRRGHGFQRLSGELLMNRQPGQQGFTLIELIMVIVIGGILAMGVTSFITHSVGGYVATARRQALGGAGMVAAEKLARAARNALPNSIRVSGNCLELIPVLAGSSYVSAPVTTAASSFQVAAYSATQSVEGRVAIYPINVAALYSPGTTTSLSSAVATLPAG